MVYLKNGTLKSNKEQTIATHNNMDDYHRFNELKRKDSKNYVI